MSTDSARARLGELLPDLRSEYGVRSLSIFGSCARGEQTAESDLDLLVELEEVPGLFAFARLQYTLEDRLGVQVDLFTRPMLKPRVAPSVKRDLVPASIPSP